MGNKDIGHWAVKTLGKKALVNRTWGHRTLGDKTLGNRTVGNEMLALRFWWTESPPKSAQKSTRESRPTHKKAL